MASPVRFSRTVPADGSTQDRSRSAAYLLTAERDRVTAGSACEKLPSSMTFKALRLAKLPWRHRLATDCRQNVDNHATDYPIVFGCS